MATITTVQSGNWSDNTASGPWPSPYTLPTTADGVVIANTHTVTLDATGLVCLSLTINSGGTLSASTTANSDLTVQTTITLGATGAWNIDLSGAYTYSCDVWVNAANSTSDQASGWLSINDTASFTYKGFPKKRKTTLTAGITAGATSATVTDATGWQVGDVIVFATTQAYNVTTRTDIVTLTSVSGGSIGWTGGITYDHATAGYVGNFSSNVRFGPKTSGYRANVAYAGAYGTAVNKTINNVAFIGGGSTQYNRSGVVSNSKPGGGLSKLTVSNCAFYQHLSAGFNVYLSQSDAGISNSVFYTDATQLSSGAYSSGISLFRQSPGVAITGCGIFRNSNTAAFDAASSGAGISFINDCYCYGQSISDTFISGCKHGLATLFNNGTISNVEVFSNDTGLYLYQSAGNEIDGLHLGAHNAGFATNSVNEKHGPSVKAIIKNSNTQTLSLTNLSTSALSHEVFFNNKNNDVTLQEIYKQFMQTKRDNSAFNRSTSSIAIYPTVISTACQRLLSIPCANGSSIRVIGYVKKSHATNVSATVALSGLGSAWAGFTKANDTNWEMWDTGTITNSSGADGNYTLTYTANSSSGTANVVYFDGVPDAPFVTKCRHYGFTYDEANPSRTTNATVSATEANALLLGDTEITVTAATSAIALNASRTLQEVYDYTQAWACTTANLGYTVPLTGVGIAGSHSLFAVGDITTTGYTLNGSGYLSMGSKTLTASLPWVYTYTGGTFSQAATVPTFADGDLTLPTAGTYTFTMSSGEIIFTATSAAWDLSGSTIDSGVTLSNTSGAGITVAMPAGYPTTTIGSGATEIIVTAPAVERGLEFTLSPTGCQVKVFATGTDTELFSDNAASGTETWDDATSGSITVDYVVQKAGYLPVRVTGVVVTGAVGTGIQAVAVTLSAARWYQASSGLTINTNAFANAGTKLFGLTAASTLQNFASYMLEQWIALGDSGEAYANKEFPIEANGPNSFTFRLGWEWDLTTYPNSINNLSRDGQRYMSAAGAVTASWAAILTSGAPAGSQVRYQQSDAGTTVNAENTGEMDQLVQIYGDATHGNFDKTGYLVLKVQREGYDQAEANVVTLYGTLEDQLYVVGLTPAANGIATGDPALTITISQGTYTEDGKTFSVKIVDNVTPSSGTDILRELRYNFAAGGAYQGEDAFNWHDLVQKNGSSFKTVRGTVYGTAATKGVLVYKNDGVTLHPDFNLFTADDGTTVTPASTVTLAWASAVAGTMILIYNDSQAGVLVEDGSGGVLASPGYSRTFTLPHADLSVGDTLRLRYASKTEDAGEITGVLSADGLTFLETQATDAAYAAWGLDGAAMSEFSADLTNIDIDIAGGGAGVTFNSQKKRIGAWWKYILTTPAGLDAFYGAFTFAGPGSIRQNVSVVDVKLQETSGAAIVFTDNNVRYYRSDNSCPYDTTPGFGSMFIDYDGQPYTVATGSGVTPTDKTEIATAVRSELATELAATMRNEKFARNKQILDPADGSRKVYDNDGTTILGQGDAFMDVAGTQPYDGSGPVHRTERLA